MLQPIELRRNCIDPNLIGNPEDVDRDPAAQVDIVFSLIINQRGAFPAHEINREAGISFCNILIIQFSDIHLTLQEHRSHTFVC